MSNNEFVTIAKRFLIPRGFYCNDCSEQYYLPESDKLEITKDTKTVCKLFNCKLENAGVYHNFISGERPLCCKAEECRKLKTNCVNEVQCNRKYGHVTITNLKLIHDETLEESGNDLITLPDDKRRANNMLKAIYGEINQ